MDWKGAFAASTAVLLLSFVLAALPFSQKAVENELYIGFPVTMLNTKRCRHFKTKSSRSARRQIMLRFINLLQLSRPNLRNAATYSKHCIRIESAVDLLKQSLRHNRSAFVIRFAFKLCTQPR